MPEPEPSVSLLASLLLGSITAAYGALVELRDRGYPAGETETGGDLRERFNKSSLMASELHKLLTERKEEALADTHLAPVAEAINLMSREMVRLSKEAVEQQAMDNQFSQITDRLNLRKEKE